MFKDKKIIDATDNQDEALAKLDSAAADRVREVLQHFEEFKNHVKPLGVSFCATLQLGNYADEGDCQSMNIVEIADFGKSDEGLDMRILTEEFLTGLLSIAASSNDYNLHHQIGCELGLRKIADVDRATNHALHLMALIRSLFDDEGNLRENPREMRSAYAQKCMEIVTGYDMNEATETPFTLSMFENQFDGLAEIAQRDVTEAPVS